MHAVPEKGGGGGEMRGGKMPPCTSSPCPPASLPSCVPASPRHVVPTFLGLMFLRPRRPRVVSSPRCLGLVVVPSGAGWGRGVVVVVHGVSSSSSLRGCCRPCVVVVVLTWFTSWWRRCGARRSVAVSRVGSWGRRRGVVDVAVRIRRGGGVLGVLGAYSGWWGRI